MRPGIVVSGATHKDLLSTVVAVPTSGIAPEKWPLRLAVGSFAGKESYAGIPGIRQVRKGRLHGVLGQLSLERLTAPDEGLVAYLH